MKWQMANSEWQMANSNDWLIWQLADSAFPAGGFAHSYGLEAAWQQDEVDAVSLPAFVRDAVVQAGRGSLPFAVAVHKNPDCLPAIDARYDAFVRNPVANRASRVQGRAWLATVERSFPRPGVGALCERVRAEGGARHYAPVFGATLRALGVDLGTSERLFLFGVCRGIVSAAVRLGIVGTTGGQRLLSESACTLDDVLARTAGLTLDDAAQTSPLIDLWQASHDRLYSRLFQS
jgi:urease accessory protein